MKIVAVGDIMPGGVLSGISRDYISQDVLNLLSSGDIRIGTLETAIGEQPVFNAEKMRRDADVIYAKDEDLTKLKDLNINIVSLANNHFFDLGIDGVKHTVSLLDKLGIKHIGAGANISEASKPVVETIEGKTVAFLAFCDIKNVGWCPYATETEPGVNPMYDDYLEKEIKAAKAQYDYVVVMPHWGKEHTYNVTDRVHSLSKKMICAGADLIVGSHPHRVQPFARYKKSIVAYSLGNFLFPDRFIVPPRATFYPEEPVDISSLPVTDEYPVVDSLTYKIWKPLARVGAVSISVFGSNGVSSDYRFVELDSRNYLTLASGDKIERHLSFNHFLLKFTPYSITYFCIRAAKSLKRRVIKLCHR